MTFNRASDFSALQLRLLRLLRLAMQQRQDIRKRVELVAETLDMPTRTEMLDVDGRLHGLMREVRARRREVRALKARGADRGSAEARDPQSRRKAGAKAGQAAATIDA